MTADDSWLVVDRSEIPSLVLSEDDAVALFEQMPHERVFTELLTIRSGGVLYMDALFVFSLCNHILRVLSEGMTAFRFYKHYVSLIGHTAASLVRKMTGFTSAARGAGIFSYTALQTARLQRELDMFYVEVCRGPVSGLRRLTGGSGRLCARSCRCGGRASGSSWPTCASPTSRPRPPGACSISSTRTQPATRVRAVRCVVSRDTLTAAGVCRPAPRHVYAPTLARHRPHRCGTAERALVGSCV
jgi:hypothetical protein